MIMSVRKEIKPGERIPAWYGIAWQRYDLNYTVCYPIPLNALVVLYRGITLWLKHGGKSVMLSPRDAFAQGFEEGQRAASRTASRKTA